MEWNLTTTIAAISTCVAAFSLTISAMSFRLAKLNRKLSLQQEARKQPQLIIQSIKSFQTVSGNMTYFSSYLHITNKSENSNALVSADLLLHLSGDWQRPIIHLDNQTKDVLKNDMFQDKLKVPTPIPANTALSGWIVFGVPTDFIADKEIIDHELQIRDLHSFVSIKPIFMRD